MVRGRGLRAEHDSSDERSERTDASESFSAAATAPVAAITVSAQVATGREHVKFFSHGHASADGAIGRDCVGATTPGLGVGAGRVLGWQYSTADRADLRKG